MFTVIIAAAGSGRRMGSGTNKILHELCGKTILQYSLETFSKIAAISEFIIVVSEADAPIVRRICLAVLPKARFKIVLGGKERQDSIANALQQISENSSYVMVHDGARPFVDLGDILNLMAEIRDGKSAVLAVPVKDTIKVVTSGVVQETPDRSKLFSIQTPQGFSVKVLREAYKNAADSGYCGTDDASLAEFAGERIIIVRGSYDNIKITTPDDMLFGETVVRKKTGAVSMDKCLRSGFGYDVHRLVENRDLVLGGVVVPHTAGLLGHSDADVLLHAVMDALLGAAALGDIGKHFPDSDEKYRGISSMELLEHVCCLLIKKGFTIINIDATLVAEKPKIAAYIPAMVANIAGICRINDSSVNVKATTTEGLGFTGNGEGMAAYATVTVAG